MIESARVGIVGLGGMGSVHARNATEFGLDVVGADVSPEQREAFERDWGVPTYASHEEMLDEEELDAVMITTPNVFHDPIAVEALEDGLDVLVEKPLSHSLEGAERIAEAAATADGFCVVGFHNRFSSSSTMFDAYQRDERFGDIQHVEANYVRRRGIPGPGSWFTDRRRSGGGALIDIGVHAIDLAMYVLDFPEVAEVTGVARTTFGEQHDYADPDGFGAAWGASDGVYDVDDSVTAFIRCANGATISLEAAWATNRPADNEFVLHGTNAGAQFELGGDSITMYEADTVGTDHYRDVQLRGDSSVQGHREQDRAFFASIGREPAPTLSTVEEGLVVQQVIDAIYRSSEEGRAVPLRLAEEVLEQAGVVTADE